MNKIISKEFFNALELIVNKYGIDNELNTPDFLVAEYIVNTLENFRVTHEKADEWAITNR